jgi:hypothetical protein
VTNQSRCQAPFRAQDQIFITARPLWFCQCAAPSFTKGWDCHCYLNRSQSQRYCAIDDLPPISSYWRQAHWDSRPVILSLTEHLRF